MRPRRPLDPPMNRWAISGRPCGTRLLGHRKPSESAGKVRETQTHSRTLARYPVRVSKLCQSLPKVKAAILLWLALTLLTFTSEAAFRPEILAQLDAAITNAIAEHKCPGVVLWIEHKGQAYHRAYGYRALLPVREPMTEDTIFDLASLTKSVATAPAIMLLIERGQVHLDDPAQHYLPEFHGDGREAITVRHLLTHTSGLLTGISGRPFSDYSSGIAQALQARPRLTPGTEFHYCDVNFILLGEIVRRVSGKPLNEFVATEFYQPLGMGDTGYLPPADLMPRIAPTQFSYAGLLRGKVHDPTARRMGGVAGQAGVFSTAADLARYCRMMLNEGKAKGVRLFKPETIRQMTHVQSPPDVLARRALGWDIDSGYSRPRGLLFPLGSYGHTGFTGTFLWIDPFSKTFVVFLSNRVHPDGRGNVRELYGEVSTLAARAIDDFNFQHVPNALSFRTNFIPWGPLTNLLEPVVRP